MNNKHDVKKSNKKIWIWSSVGCLGIMLIFIILAFSACTAFFNEVDKDVDKIETSSEVKTETESKPKDKVTEPKSGSRNNPVNFNNPAIVNAWIHGTQGVTYDAKLEVQLIEVIRGDAAMEILAKENQFNEKPMDGYEWALVKLHGKVVEAETDDETLLFSSLNFRFVSQNGDTYENKSAVVPNTLFHKLYSGGEGEGFIFTQVKIEDDFSIVYEDKKTSPIFFSTK